MKICAYMLAGTLIAGTGAAAFDASPIERRLMDCDDELSRVDEKSFNMNTFDKAFQRARIRFAQDQSKDALDEYEYANFQLHLNKSELIMEFSAYASCLLNVLWEMEADK